MNIRVVTPALLALMISAGAIEASPASVPLLYRSDPTDTAAAPRVVAARDGSSGELGARLVSAPSGRFLVSFERGSQAPGRFVYLGFTFTADEAFAVRVTPEKPLASVSVSVNGVELRRVANAPGAYANLIAPKGPFSVVVRLERSDPTPVPVSVALAGFKGLPQLVPDVIGQVSDAPPAGLSFDLTLGGDSGPADVLIPAIVRAAGLHGPVRSDVALFNESSSKVVATLALVSGDGSASVPKPVTLAPHARLKVTDVVKFLLGDSADAQGALAIRGFVPATPGGLTAETYYDNGQKGRVGTTLPLFLTGASRATPSILAAGTDGDPRLILFSSPNGSGLAAHVAKIRVDFGGGAPLSFPLDVPPGAYASARVADLIGTAPSGEGTLSIETDDPGIHALLVRSDPASGAPYLTASN